MQFDFKTDTGSGGNKNRDGSTTAPSPYRGKRGKKALSDFRNAYFTRYVFRMLGRHGSAWGRIAYWAYIHDPHETQENAERFDRWLEEQDFLWYPRLRDAYSDWKNDGAHRLELSWMTTRLGHDWQFNLQAPHYVSCDNANVPGDVGCGAGASAWTGCPGGACDGSFVNVATQTFTGYEAKLVSSVHTGGGFWTHYSYMWGPNSCAIPRFGLKTKICAPATTYEPTWDRNITPRYLTATRTAPQVLPAPDTLRPPRPFYSISNPGRDKPDDDRKRKLYEEPGVEWRLSVSPKEHVEPRTIEHKRRPPKQGEKEKKRRLPWPVIRQVITRLYDASTEAKDVVDALFDALPKSRQCGGAKSMNDRAYCVWKNMQYVDIDKAIWNLIKNEIGDRIVGRFVGNVGRYTPYGTIGQGMKAPSPPKWVFAR